jgi:predicted dehydrogenase
MTAQPPASVLLVGIHGHGRWHLENLRRLEAAGAPVRLAGLCDTRAPEDGVSALVGDVPFRSSLADALDDLRPEVTIVCTPMHTHAALTLMAARAGSHVLLEKPPTPTLDDFDGLERDLSATDAACQVGFQSLGGHAIEHVRRLVADGAIGEVVGIGAAGTWQRDAAYYARAPWAGRRVVDGVPVVDGALTNPFAHATATALALDGEEGAVSDLEIELYRANPIEGDDTSSLRLVTSRGTRVTVAVTLCAERAREPYVVVHGSHGRVSLEYRTGVVRLEAGGRVETSRYDSTDLVENLVAHVRHGDDLLVPLPSTRPFMQVLDAVRLAPDPVQIPERYRQVDAAGSAPRVVVPGIDAAVERAALSLQPFSALDLPWAVRQPAST